MLDIWCSLHVVCDRGYVLDRLLSNNLAGCWTFIFWGNVRTSVRTFSFWCGILKQIEKTYYLSGCIELTESLVYMHIVIYFYEY